VAIVDLQLDYAATFLCGSILKELYAIPIDLWTYSSVFINEAIWLVVLFSSAGIVDSLQANNHLVVVENSNRIGRAPGICWGGTSSLLKEHVLVTIKWKLSND